MRSSREGKGGSVSAQPANCANCSAPLPKGARFCASCGTAGPERRHRARRRAAERDRARPGNRHARDAAVVRAGAADRPVRARSRAAGRRRRAARDRQLGRRARPARARAPLRRGFLEAGRRKPDAPIVTASVGAVDSARARAGYTAQAFLTRSSARREIIRRRGEAMRLEGERERLLGQLGAAVYAGADERPSARRSRAWTSGSRASSGRPRRSPRAPRSGSRLPGGRCSRPRSGTRTTTRVRIRYPYVGFRARQGQPSARRSQPRVTRRVLLLLLLALLTAAPAAVTT